MELCAQLSKLSTHRFEVTRAKRVSWQIESTIARYGDFKSSKGEFLRVALNANFHTASVI